MTVSELAPSSFASSDPTAFPSCQRIVVTPGGRLLVVHGKHADGVQLSWSDDQGATWSRVTRGSVTDGRIWSGLGTGDLTSAIATYGDAAWIVSAGDDSGDTRDLTLRRLTDIDNPAGPNVGPLVVMDAGGANAGNSKVDCAVEVTSGGVARVAVLWLGNVGASLWDLSVGWITDLTTDTPTFNTVVPLLDDQTGGSRQGCFIQRDAGLAVISRTTLTGGSNLKPILRNRDDPLTTWSTTAVNGAADASLTFPAGAWFNNRWYAVGCTNTTTGVCTVNSWAADGSAVVTELTTAAGYWEPSLVVLDDGLYVVMRTGAAAAGAADTVVSRKYNAANDWTADLIELAGRGGFHEYPSVLRDGRGFGLVIVAPAPGDSVDQRQLLAVTRNLVAQDDTGLLPTESIVGGLVVDTATQALVLVSGVPVVKHVNGWPTDADGHVVTKAV